MSPKLLLSRLSFLALFVLGCPSAPAETGLLSDKSLTPGAISEVEVEPVCQPGYARKARKNSACINLPDKTKGRDPFLPDPKLTPGDALRVTAATLCRSNYAASVRDVPAKRKKEVFREYGIVALDVQAYEIDHLVSLELGGSNEIKNLWAQPYFGIWNARVKDKLENKLHREVCRGAITLTAAQHAEAKDWINLYKQEFNTERPVPLRKGSNSSRE